MLTETILSSTGRQSSEYLSVNYHLEVSYKARAAVVHSTLTELNKHVGSQLHHNTFTTVFSRQRGHIFPPIKICIVLNPGCRQTRRTP